jgi:hypothetical protein
MNSKRYSVMGPTHIIRKSCNNQRSQLSHASSGSRNSVSTFITSSALSGLQAFFTISHPLLHSSIAYPFPSQYIHGQVKPSKTVKHHHATNAVFPFEEKGGGKRICTRLSPAARALPISFLPVRAQSKDFDASPSRLMVTNLDIFSGPHIVIRCLRCPLFDIPHCRSLPFVDVR